MPEPLMQQPRWLELAWSDLGVAEVPGPQSSATVLRYYADAGHPEIGSDDVAWCAAFVGACLDRAGIAGTRSLLARSYLDWGTALTEPRLGAVAVLPRGSDPALGHVGFLVGVTADSLLLLGGNQSGCVGVAPFARTVLLGLRWPETDAAPASGEEADFARALAHVLEMEGGWTDDPYDPGGPTNFGITLATYAGFTSAPLNSPSAAAALKAELKKIPQSVVCQIYLERYWRPSCAARLPPALALMHFDAGVNHGVAGAARMLQEAVGAAIDGDIGPLTLAAAAARPPVAALTAYADIRRRRYRALSTFWRFGRGWLARVDRTLAAALALVPADPQPTSNRNEQETDMPTPTTTPALPWWGSSLSIWGTAITALSTVLPVLGPLLGLNVTPDLVQLLGQQIVEVVQALGGVIGTVMAIYGHSRVATLVAARPAGRARKS
ncbi:MAG: TIGR02594 family protein [Hyphomicrobiaceae bacterium]